VSVIVKLDDLLHERRMTLTELSERIGITLANLSVLKTGKARAIRFSTLDAICTALQCRPGDLLEFAPAPPQTSTEAHSPPGRETETAL
jgi:putative transcriptional regulator